MKKIALYFAIIAASFASCKKGGTDPVKTPVRTFTTTLDLRPSNNDSENKPVTLNRTKNIFLSLSKGQVYNMDNAKENASDIDLVIYDGHTVGTAIGGVRLISPGGSGASLSGTPSDYGYLKPGTTNESIRYYTLIEMNEWTRFNQSNIHVPLTGAKNFNESDFSSIQNTDDLDAAIKSFKSNNPEAAGRDRDLTSSSIGFRSKFIRVVYEKNGSTAEALIHIKEYQYLPNGYITLEVKTFP